MYFVGIGETLGIAADSGIYAPKVVRWVTSHPPQVTVAGHDVTEILAGQLLGHDGGVYRGVLGMLNVVTFAAARKLKPVVV